MLLTRLPLSRLLYCYRMVTARLACVRHAASVSSEPGSNSPLTSCIPKRATFQSPPTGAVGWTALWRWGSNRNERSVALLACTARSAGDRCAMRTTSGGLNPSLMRVVILGDFPAAAYTTFIDFPRQKRIRPAYAGPVFQSMGPTNYSRLRCLVFKEQADVSRRPNGLKFVPPSVGTWILATQNIVASGF